MVNDNKQLICFDCNNEIGIGSDTSHRNYYYKIEDKIICSTCYSKKSEKIKLLATRYKIDYIEQQILKRKACAKCRNKQLDPDSNMGIGYITEVLVSKFLNIPTCFELTDNFNYSKYDLLEHKDWGKINAKGSTLLNNRGHEYWFFCTNKNTKPDTFFCIGYDALRKHIETVYYIPNTSDIQEKTAIHINKNWVTKKNTYYKFKQDPKPWDDLYHSFELENCPVLSPKVTDINMELISTEDCRPRYARG